MGSVRGATGERIEALADGYLASGYVVALEDPGPPDAGEVIRRSDGRIVVGERDARYSTPSCSKQKLRWSRRSAVGHPSGVRLPARWNAARSSGSMSRSFWRPAAVFECRMSAAAATFAARIVWATGRVSALRIRSS